VSDRAVARRLGTKTTAVLGSLVLAIVLGRAVVWRYSWDLGYLVSVGGFIAALGAVLPAPRPARGIAIAGGASYLPQLDGLRFLAFLLVLGSHLERLTEHAFVFGIQENGWIGVDLFFVISSFLFFLLLFREQERTGTINIRYFFVRRILRIWPLYFGYLVLILVTTGNPLTTIPKLIVEYPRIRGAFFFYDNVLTSMTASYNVDINDSSHLWTLSYEEQVYLGTPFLAWMTIAAYRRGRERWVALLFVLIPGLGILLRFYLVGLGARHPSIWVIPFLRSETIFAGFLLAMFVRSKTFHRVPTAIYPMLVVACLCYLFGDFGPVNLDPHSSMTVYVALAIGFSGLVLTALRDDGLAARFFGSRPLAFLGKISFGLYVWHLLGMRLASEYVLPSIVPFLRRTPIEIRWVAGVLSTLAVTVSLAVASYYLFERPFLRLKKRFTLVESRPI